MALAHARNERLRLPLPPLAPPSSLSSFSHSPSPALRPLDHPPPSHTRAARLGR
ncbi:hypothetical protein M433DRAFT_141616 [Acidomyces richmondensis BFW]|nr:MAG: hypothetical protein FE78DRAFT_83358 [Acidomyces sp. 'richmondensis']KYG47841.1 hypothetical protein M433DRAFT_141616 [Acidomyces richmondensis BFW]